MCVCVCVSLIGKLTWIHIYKLAKQLKLDYLLYASPLFICMHPMHVLNKMCMCVYCEPLRDGKRALTQGYV